MLNDTQIPGAISDAFPMAEAHPGTSFGGAKAYADTLALLPRRTKIERADTPLELKKKMRAHTICEAAPSLKSKVIKPRKAGKAKTQPKPVKTTPSLPVISLSGLTVHVPQEAVAAQFNSVAGQHVAVTQKEVAGDGIQPQLVEQWRRRQDMLRARQRLELQAMAVCRRYRDGDKVEGMKLWLEVKANPAHDLRVWLAPFIAAMAPLDTAKAEIEKALAKLVKQLPVYGWAKAIPGLGDVSFAGILGECAIGPGEYRTVSALWKRMGLAVIDGGRQRRVLGAAALDHGYNAERRSLMWNVAASLIKAQLRSIKGDDGKKIEGSSYALGELGQVYLDRKAYLVARNATLETAWTPAHIHNDAGRYMTKRLLRSLWQEWRRARGSVESNEQAPAAKLTEELCNDRL